MLFSLALSTLLCASMAAAQVMSLVTDFEPVAGSLGGFPAFNLPGFNTATGCRKKCQTTPGCFASVFKAVHEGQPSNVCWLKGAFGLTEWIPLPNGAYCSNPNERCSVWRKTGTPNDSPPFFRNMRTAYIEPTAQPLSGWPQSNVPATATAALCEAWCKYYADCKAFVYKPMNTYCALYGYQLSWTQRGGANSVCPAGETCVIKRKSSA